MDYTPISFDRIYAYLRKSRADGETETVEEVLAKHEAMMQEYMERIYGKRLPPERIFREVRSGETISSRPVVQMLIGMIFGRIRAGNFRRKICWHNHHLVAGDKSTGDDIIQFTYIPRPIIV